MAGADFRIREKTERSGGRGRSRSIGVLVERRYLQQAQPSGLVAALSSRGHAVTILDPQSSCYRVGDDGWLRDLDLMVARGRSWAVLCLLSWAESCGLPTLNRRAAIAAVHNKAEMALRLASGGLPTPLTLLGTTRELASHAGSRYPLVLKPVFGDNGRGLLLVNSREELLRVEWPEPVALAQQFVRGDGCDLKLYGIGGQLWAVRKPALLQPGQAASAKPGGEVERVPLTPALRRLGRRCRALFGLELFGMDCIETTEGPVVIEVNEFPNYSAIPEADERLAEYVLQRARQGRRS